MSTILSVYTRNAYKEYQLPAVNNEDYELGISAQIFQLKEDVTLYLESVNGNWKIKHSRKYVLTKAQGDPYGYLQQDDVISVVTYQEEQVSIVVTKSGNTFPVIAKYDISKLSQISIGAAEENDICYSFLNFVSRKHAILKKTEHGWLIEDISSNGVFLNERKLEHSIQLQVGDFINIFGLKLVYLDGKLAVHAVNQNIKISSVILPLHYIETGNQERRQNMSIKLSREKTYFHRAPRNVIQLDTEPVEIEAPPAQKVLSKKPLFMTIGPSFTMMIPMLLGTLLAMYGSKGSNSSFMYTGIITAAGSAILGVFWALVNLNYEKKTTVEEEKKRFQSYSNYLMQQVEMIKAKYDKSRNSLLELYPDTQTCITYNSKNPALWNRNRSHEDFLVHRLGLGNLPFQVPIQIPKERFSLSDDALMQKPGMIRSEYETLYDVPVCLDLSKYHVIGVIGGSGKQGEFLSNQNNLQM